MDNVGLLKHVVAETSRVVNNTSSAALDNASPCEGWTVRDVLNHITGGATMFAISAEDGSVADDVIGQLMGGDNLGADPKRAWQTAADRALAAFEQPGVLEKMVKLPFGEMPAGVALNIAVFDVATHACDIAYSTGQQIEDEATFEQALEMGKQFVGPDFRVPGVFGEEQTCAADAAIQTRILAFGGRKL